MVWRFLVVICGFIMFLDILHLTSLIIIIAISCAIILVIIIDCAHRIIIIKSLEIARIIISVIAINQLLRWSQIVRLHRQFAILQTNLPHFFMSVKLEASFTGVIITMKGQSVLWTSGYSHSIPCSLTLLLFLWLLVEWCSWEIWLQAWCIYSEMLIVYLIHTI